MNADPLLEVEQVTKTYHLPGQDVPALRGVDLRIDSPGFYAIMGPSGSGKSTLMHLCAAMDAPDTGSIRVAGTELSELDEAGRTNFRRRGMGIVFQQFNLVPRLDVVSNVLTGKLNRYSNLTALFNLFPRDDVYRAIDI